MCVFFFSAKMSEMRGSNTWHEELASLVDDTGIRYAGEPIGVSSAYVVSGESRSREVEPESLKDQVKGFAMAWGEIVVELGRGCKDIVQQSLLSEDSYVGRKLQKPCAKVSNKLKYLNEFLPEDRDPAHSWSVIFFVFVLALAGEFQCNMIC